MNKPNYKNGSIVNLMASIKKCFGGESDYEPLKDFVLGEKRNIYIGNHGGTSLEEMFVPLVVIK